MTYASPNWTRRSGLEPNVAVHCCWTIAIWSRLHSVPEACKIQHERINANTNNFILRLSQTCQKMPYQCTQFHSLIINSVSYSKGNCRTALGRAYNSTRHIEIGTVSLSASIRCANPKLLLYIVYLSTTIHENPPIVLRVVLLTLLTDKQTAIKT